MNINFLLIFIKKNYKLVERHLLIAFAMATNQNALGIASPAFNIAQESFFGRGIRVFDDGYVDDNGNFQQDLDGRLTFNLADNATAAALEEYEETADALVDALVNYGYSNRYLEDIFRDLEGDSHYHTVSNIFERAIENLYR